MPQLITHGRVIRPALGITLIADSTQRRLQIPGPMVARVAPGGPADAAGLRGLQEDPFGRVSLGDVITHVDGARTPDSDSLLGALEKHEVGDRAELTVLRGDRRLNVSVTLSAGQ